MNWIKEHKLLFIALIVAVVITIGYGLSQSGSSAAPQLTTASAVSATTPGDQELVSTLLALRAVTLSGTIFSDPAFISLHDNGTTIVSEPVGRDNPFAPLQVAADTSATSTHQAQIFAPKTQ